MRITTIIVTSTATPIATTARLLVVPLVIGSFGNWIVGHVWLLPRTNSMTIVVTLMTLGLSSLIAPFGTR
ncbi:unnamed protein product [Linum tenue]|uniref:Uncharacterized protein n=1 Tax=Linum tenue TaxID=586396 RepID=A0AAV0L7A9_9ROSI|nr:unnamed protein product [Linum tenue]